MESREIMISTRSVLTSLKEEPEFFSPLSPVAVAVATAAVSVAITALPVPIVAVLGAKTLLFEVGLATMLDATEL